MLQECHTLMIVLLYGSFEELFYCFYVHHCISTKIYQLKIVGYLRYNNNTFSQMMLSILAFSLFYKMLISLPNNLTLIQSNVTSITFFVLVCFAK